MEAERYRFGVFELDATTGELRREGVVVRLQAQPALVLACLVRATGEVVSREELCKAVWGKETFVDFERGLNFCIAQIRDALHDDALAPRYVRTIPKRGYQFIAPVERLGQTEPATANTTSTGDETRTSDSTQIADAGRRAASRLLLAAAVVAVLVVAAFGVGYRWRRVERSVAAAHPAAARPAVVAVVRFDNETTDIAMTRFADGLTDSLVEQLTSQSRERYSVIGNAAILRLPRDLRDLNEIASSLGAGYIVLGQVQASGTQTRVLAHLIRMPDQTHIWVVRQDRAIADVLAIESELAQKIGTDFSERIARDVNGPPLPSFSTH